MRSATVLVPLFMVASISLGCISSAPKKTTESAGKQADDERTPDQRFADLEGQHAKVCTQEIFDTMTCRENLLLEAFEKCQVLLNSGNGTEGNVSRLEANKKILTCYLIKSKWEGHYPNSAMPTSSELLDAKNRLASLQQDLRNQCFSAHGAEAGRQQCYKQAAQCYVRACLGQSVPDETEGEIKKDKWHQSNDWISSLDRGGGSDSKKHLTKTLLCHRFMNNPGL